MPGTIEVTRPVAPGAGLVRADEDVAAGAELVARRSAAARPPTSGCSPRRASRQVAVHARPASRSSPPATRSCPPYDARAGARPGARRHRVGAGRARDRRRGRAGRSPGSCPTTAARSPRRPARGAAARRPGRGLGRHRSVGARDETAGAVAALGDDLVPRTRDPARQADAARRVRRRAGDRAARQPAVGARRVPARRRARWCGASSGLDAPPPEPAPGPAWPATSRPRRAGSTSCRSSCATGWRTPCSGRRRCCRCSPAPTATSWCPSPRPGWTAAPRSTVTLHR